MAQNLTVTHTYTERGRERQCHPDYVPILDENNFSYEDLQRAIHTLTYVWEKTSSGCGSTMAAPARCAMQATRRGRSFLYRLGLATTAADKDAAKERLEKESEQNFVHKMLKNTMYYM